MECNPQERSDPKRNETCETFVFKMMKRICLNVCRQGDTVQQCMQG